MDTDHSPAIDVDELRRRAEEIDWWHTMDLGHGITTRGRDRTQEKMGTMGLPARLDGNAVLDIGAWDGAFSFESERRGAERVLAVDPLWDNADLPGYDKRGFELACTALQSSVEDAHVNVHELDPSLIGTFDLVLFLGVLYHLRNPFGALQRIAGVMNDGGQLIIETEGDLLDIRRPAAAFYPFDELNRDKSNWWGLNRAALIGMLEQAGYRDAQIVYCPSRPRRLARAARDRFRRDAAFNASRSQGRVVVHAWRSA